MAPTDLTHKVLTTAAFLLYDHQIYRLGLSFQTAKTLHTLVELLPSGPKWVSQEIHICQGHSAPRCLQRGLSYPRMPISPKWVVLVKLYAMKALWPCRYEHGGGPRQVDYNQ
jgi:hypothetical protein